MTCTNRIKEEYIVDKATNKQFDKETCFFKLLSCYKRHKCELVLQRKLEESELTLLNDSTVSFS